MDNNVLSAISSTMVPGQRLPRVKGGWMVVDKTPMPRDCEGVFFDEDEDYFYLKKTDANGGYILRRFSFEEDPIPQFDPKKYVTVDDFNSFKELMITQKEEILDGFKSLQQAIAGNGQSANATVNSTANAADSSTKSVNQPGKPNTGIGQPAGNI